jgi:lipopolysaccharide transport system ATP-binding protein
MSEVAGEGRTVLFVSHTMTAIQSLCNRAIWLEDGQIAEDGPTDQVIGHYLRATTSTTASITWADPDTAPGGEGVRLRQVSVRPADGKSGDLITCHSPVILRFEYLNQVAGAHLRLSSLVTYQNGVVVFATRSVTDPHWHGKGFPKGVFASEFQIPGDILNDGTYSVSIRFMKDETITLYYNENIFSFDVVDPGNADSQWIGNRYGVIRLSLPWETHLIEGSSHP